MLLAPLGTSLTSLIVLTRLSFTDCRLVGFGSACCAVTDFAGRVLCIITTTTAAIKTLDSLFTHLNSTQQIYIRTQQHIENTVGRRVFYKLRARHQLAFVRDLRHRLQERQQLAMDAFHRASRRKPHLH